MVTALKPLSVGARKQKIKKNKQTNKQTLTKFKGRALHWPNYTEAQAAKSKFLFHKKGWIKTVENPTMSPTEIVCSVVTSILGKFFHCLVRVSPLPSLSVAISDTAL